MDYINEYTSKTDEELISIIQTGNEAALNVLIERYQNVVKINSNKFFLYGSDENDVYQEGMLGLFFAIRNYDPKNGASFKTFAKLCIDRQLITAIKSSNRQKHYLLNNAISINATLENDNDSSEIINFLKDQISEDPSEIIANNEYYQNLNFAIQNVLSPKELNVLEEFKKGKSYSEIAETLTCNVKSVDTALTRIRRKASIIKEKIDKNEFE